MIKSLTGTGLGLGELIEGKRKEGQSQLPVSVMGRMLGVHPLVKSPDTSKSLASRALSYCQST